MNKRHGKGLLFCVFFGLIWYWIENVDSTRMNKFDASVFLTIPIAALLFEIYLDGKL